MMGNVYGVADIEGNHQVPVLLFPHRFFSFLYPSFVGFDPLSFSPGSFTAQTLSISRESLLMCMSRSDGSGTRF